MELVAESDSQSPEYISAVMPDVWVYNGEAYDLSDFIQQHPGGAFFIGRMKNRDMTTLVNIMHPNPAKVKRQLQKYALGRAATADDLQRTYNAPPFLFKADFEAKRDTPHFDFERESQLLSSIQHRLNTPENKRKIVRMDALFDGVTAVLMVAYFGVQALRLHSAAYMPLFVFVLLMVILRVSLSGAGHYLNHRPLINWNRLWVHIFDLNYVPMAFVVIDGHTLMHHPHTQSEVDIKRNVFTAMMDLPRYYRLPLHTCHKLAHVITGMFGRMGQLCLYGWKYGVACFYGSWQKSFPHYLGLIGMRLLLLGELVLFWQQGEIVAWLAQFLLTLWISTFMIVASHNFEEDGMAAHPTTKDDWAVFQIEHSFDLTMIGNPYVDCFLSAGLSPHRVHHVLPYQRSGFANIASEAVVREEAEKFGVVWAAPKNFFIDRLPSMVRYYLLSPARFSRDQDIGLFKEHFSLQAFQKSARYVYQGLIGIGSI